MALVRMDIASVVLGSGSASSMVVLQPHKGSTADPVKLPIKIGTVEASAIGLGTKKDPSARPITHDLALEIIARLGAKLSSVTITGVQGSTFYALLTLTSATGEHISIDARPSDVLALAVRAQAPIYATERVLSTAACPDLNALRATEQQRAAQEFHDFVSKLYPDDFSRS